MPPHKPTNRLAQESSPYLLQHAHNPVDWYPWGEEALAAAKAQDKPIFLSIGYSACHWCHVMERESFEQEAVAGLMNSLFINIKVDREERPDLDAIYMDAVQAMTGQGGWPMSVFLTPDGQPFYGGTYYPPEPRYGMPSFVQVLHSVADAYAKRRDQVLGQAGRLTQALQRMGQLSADDGDLGTELLDEAVEKLRQYFDEYHGGFGSQPKFPQPMTLDFILGQYLRSHSLDVLFMAELTLDKMAQGGLYDQVGGGFHRYSVDTIWLTPHFEKMLYDNAQLLRAYLHGWQVTKENRYRVIVEETLDYVLREMTSPEGGFYSTQDADSEGEEGKFFVWTPAEVEAVLGPELAKLFNAAYGVTAVGNFEGKNIPHVTQSVPELARRFQMTEPDVEAELTAARHQLFLERKKRVHPGRDEKILAEWNGLMIHAMAECGVALGRADALAAARTAAEFVLTHMSQEDGRLLRSYKDGQARFNAYLEDYASLVRALLALYEATFDLRWLGEATRLAKLMTAQFLDPENGGFFQTGADHERLVVRRKDLIDNAVPSGNSLAAESLIRLSVLTGNLEHRHEAGRILRLMREQMGAQPNGFGRMLSALDAYLAPSQEVAIVGSPQAADTQALLQVVRQNYLPNTVLALKHPDEESPLPLLESRSLVNGSPAAYVCENYACRLPVTTPAALAQMLAQGRG